MIDNLNKTQKIFKYLLYEEKNETDPFPRISYVETRVIKGMGGYDEYRNRVIISKIYIQARKIYFLLCGKNNIIKL